MTHDEALAKVVEIAKAIATMGLTSIGVALAVRKPLTAANGAKEIAWIDDLRKAGEVLNQEEPGHAENLPGDGE